MPELPEVETTLRGISAHLINSEVSHVEIRTEKLRWPFQEDMNFVLRGQVIRDITRRGKYLLVRCAGGTLIMHLGMSGSLRLVPPGVEPGPHDHFDLATNTGPVLRLTDPRKFGSLVWTEKAPEEHTLLKDLGPEPLEERFSADYLHQAIQRRKRAIKLVIMDSRVVPGVGNIYANESLFEAGIRPETKACDLTLEQCTQLVDAIKAVLARAIEAGGTTLKDFVGAGGRPGYFQQELKVYGRGGEPCVTCNTVLEETRLDNRTTVFCPTCQS